MKKISDAEYRRQYDRLYVASMRAGSREESEKIDRKLQALNARRKLRPRPLANPEVKK